MLCINCVTNCVIGIYVIMKVNTLINILVCLYIKNRIFNLIEPKLLDEINLVIRVLFVYKKLYKSLDICEFL